MSTEEAHAAYVAARTAYLAVPGYTPDGGRSAFAAFVAARDAFRSVSLTTFRVTYDNGDIQTVDMAPGITLAEAQANYIGHRFEIDEHTFRTGVAVEQL